MSSTEVDLAGSRSPGWALRAGHDLVRLRDRWSLRLPEGSFLDLHTDLDTVAELVPVLSGRSGRTGHRLSSSAALLLADFRRQGFLAGAVTGPGPDPGPRRVVVLGRGPVADALVAVLTGPGTAVRHETASIGQADLEDVLTGATAVVGVADRPAHRDSTTATLETRVPQAGATWLGVHDEGGRVFIGPPRRRPDDPGSRDVTLRREAATRVRRHVRAAEQAVVRGPGTLLTPAGAAVVAGVIGSVLAEVGRSRPIETPGHAWSPALLHVVHLDPVSVTRHPVLPVPEIEPL